MEIKRKIIKAVKLFGGDPDTIVTTVISTILILNAVITIGLVFDFEYIFILAIIIGVFWSIIVYLFLCITDYYLKIERVK